MNNKEREDQGIAVDEWCWTDMIREYAEAQDALNAAIDKIKAGE